ncbi:O-antigen ligase family protein [Bosea psychrotolerans]|nr:O-antigen ligase family protein [Bosea psychrotolerans]
MLIMLPPAMWAANRSAPLLLSLAALAVLAADALAGRLSERLMQARALLLRPLALALLGFLAWALVTLLWSHLPRAGLAMYGELVLSLASGFVVALCWPQTAPARARRALGWSLALTGILVLGELRLGPGLRDALGLRSQLYIFNRPLLTCLLLLAPAVYGLWTAPGGGRGSRALAGLVAVFVTAAIMAGESGAAKLGLMLMAASWLVALALPRLALAGVAVAFVAMMAIAPVLGPLADRVLPAGVYEQLARAHARDRVEIWLSFGEAIRARPLTGFGFGTSAALRTHPAAAAVSEPHRLLLDVGHPHNAFLQVWVETGLIGVLLISAAGLAFLGRLRHMPARALAPRLAVVAAALGVASVGHGAWQGWWIAALGATAIWFMSIGRNDASRNVAETSR